MKWIFKFTKKGKMLNSKNIIIKSYAFNKLTEPSVFSFVGQWISLYERGKQPSRCSCDFLQVSFSVLLL